ncbi:coproporphyrinogen III oxidase [Gorillibacterium timonense]|uniref:coproporphyrinogen III oxidase n=1 Tax=Gorillibacterium timonense TaxID=1689269 RepID=UPI00071DD488|nr:coproporphyrinogen III oxidase [Gorillibacterium timonense]
MKIIVRRTGFADHHMELFHLVKQFYEDAELFYDPEPEMEPSEGDLELRFHVHTAKGQVEVQAELLVLLDHAEASVNRTNANAADRARSKVSDGEETTEMRSFTTDHNRPFLGEEEEDIRRTVKRAIGFTAAKLLQEATGIRLPWGTLTGVRPTKLLHNLLRQHEREECIRILREDYLVTEEKAELVTGIAELQLQVIPDLFYLDNEVSVYIGIPFCPTKCAYCTFPAYDIRGNTGSVEGFLEGLQYEIRETGEWLKKRGLTVTTLYFGGGTPTSIEAEQMDALFEELHRSFPDMDRIRELTVEAGRPDTITPDKLAVLNKWGVDRISINPQSFTQATLDTIGRHHTVKETEEKFILARDLGMSNINMDLIIGLPNEGVDDYRASLAKTEELLPESLTVHTLSYKRASRMTQNKDDYRVASRDDVQAMMDLTTAWTADHGYVPYYLYRQKNILGSMENVGYSFPGMESLYNILMMEDRQTIVGLGCGAVSKLLYPASADEERGHEKIERFPNPKEPNAYIEHYRDYTARKLKLLDEVYGK